MTHDMGIAAANPAIALLGRHRLRDRVDARVHRGRGRQAVGQLGVDERVLRADRRVRDALLQVRLDRKSTRLNSSHRT